MRSNRSRPKAGFTLLELLIVVAMIMLLAGLVITVARQIYIARLEQKTRVHIEVYQTALGAYYLENQEFPFETATPTQQGRTLAAVGDELVAKDKLSRKQADDNKLDAWGANFLYLLYDYRKTPHPTVAYVAYSGVPSGNWSTRINALMSTGDFDWRSSHPVIGSAGADGVFGTEDDIYNVKSY